MPNQFVNKVIYGGQTIIDLTADTVTVKDVAAGVKFHDKTGAVLSGSSTFDADTSDGTATSDEILNTKIAYVNSNRIVGRMPNNGSKKLVFINKDTPVKIPIGYHDGSGEVSISAEDAGKLVGKNIRSGVTILGVPGEMTGTEGVNPQPSKTVTPTKEGLTVLPDVTYDYLTEVVVKPIPYVLSDNPAGGQTATIG